MVKVKIRSRAYPGHPLSQSVDDVKQIKKSLGSGAFDRATIAKCLGIAEATSIRRIAAMVHFGLLEAGRENRYTITEAGRIVSNPLEDELRPTLANAAQRPSLHRDLLTEFAKEGYVPEQLQTILHRKYGIADNAAQLAASVFIDSLTYAGLIDDNRRLTLHPVAEGATAREPESNSGSDSKEQRAVRQHEGADRSVDGQRFVLRLSGGRTAELLVPSVLTESDIRLIRKQVDVLELQVEIMDDAGNS